MSKYKRQLETDYLNLASVDTTDRSPEGHVFSFQRSRLVKDIFCIAREKACSPILKAINPSYCNSKFTVFAKEWSVSIQRQRLFCASELGGLSDKSVLVLGCGFGDDAIEWISSKPRKIIGVDAVNYKKCWDSAASLYSTHQTSLSFLQRDLIRNDWGFIDSGSIDIIFSYAVLEHISDLSLLLEHSWNALKPGGLFIATYGPLWFGPDGDHIHSLSADDHFNHLLLDDNCYEEYVERIKSEKFHFEHACEGPFLLERGLFSYLRPDEYLELYAFHGFEIVKSLLNISSSAERYFRKFPDHLPLLMRKHNLRELDLFANGSFVILKKNISENL